MTFEITKEKEQEIRKRAEEVSRNYAIDHHFSRSYRQLSFQEEVFDLDEEGNVLRSEKFDGWQKAREKADEWLREIFDKGEQDRHWIMMVRIEESEHTVYDPDLMMQWKDDEIKKDIRYEIARMKIEAEKQNRYARWDEAVQWCKDHGVRTCNGYNRRKTLVKNIIKNDLQEEFNETFPEFKINEDEIAWWENFWNKEEERYIERRKKGKVSK